MSEQQEKSKGKKLVIFLLVAIGILTGSAGFLAKVAFVDKADEIDTLQRKSTSAEDRVKRLNRDINKAEELLKSINIQGLDSNLLGEGIAEIQAYKAEKEASINTLRDQIQQLLAESDGQAKNFSQFKALYAKLKTDVYLLRSEVSKLKAKNQALISENAKLKQENTKLGIDLNGANKSNAELSDANQSLEGKVKLGKRLQTFEKIAEGIKLRRNGEEKSTNRARRADKIRIAFTIGKNELAAAGNLNLYLRVFDPNDRVISDGGSEFQYKNEKLLYTSKETINYQNETTDVILYGEKVDGKEFEEGNYKVQVYSETDMILVETFSLK